MSAKQEVENKAVVEEINLEKLFSDQLPSPFDYPLSPNTPFYIQPEHNSPEGIETTNLREEANGLLLEAQEAIKKIDDPEKKGESILDAAAVKLILGEDVSEVVDQAIKLTPHIRYIIAANLITNQAAIISAYAGDFEKAHQLAKRAANNNEPWPLRYSARIVNAMGGDPEPFLESMQKVLQLERAKQTERRHNFPGLFALTLSRTAQSMQQLGKDPMPYLTEAEELLEGSQTESWAYTQIAYAYTNLGDYEKALSLVDKIKLEDDDKTAKKKSEALSVIAHRQAKQGDFKDALETAAKSGRPRTVCNIHLAKAHSQSMAGEDPTQEIGLAVSNAETMEGKINYKPSEYQQALIYSQAGRILALFGGESSVYFETASKTANSLDSESLKISCLMEIAPNLSAGGVDTTLLFENVITSLDTDNTGELKSPGNLFDIHESALESGHTEFVDKLMALLDAEKHRYGQTYRDIVVYWKPAFLLKTAQVHARWSRSQ